MNLRDELGGLAGQAPSYASSDKALQTAKRRRAVKMTAAPLAAVAAIAVAIPLALQNIGGGSDGIDGASGLDTVEYITPGGPNGHDVLHTAGGRELEIPAFFTGVRTVIAVPNGWVLGANGNSHIDGDGDGEPDGGGAGLIDRDGELTMLTGPDADAVLNAVSADGSLIAWLMPDDVLHVAEIGPSGAENEVTTPVEPGVDVLAWSGDLLAIGQSPNDVTLPQRWDVWDPRSGDFEPDWAEGVLETVALPDERALVSVRENDDPCLVYLDTSTGNELGKRCQSFIGGPLDVSPDGKTLYLRGEADGGVIGQILDLEAYLNGGEPTPACGQGMDLQVDWTPGGELFVLSGATLQECSTTGAVLGAKKLPDGSRLVGSAGA
ncbi:hypothetical protein [Phytomonospora endophytica]|uniref:WD40 repeat domain-containing protein n=1 Tax=Phytomonospora endophytica TaxID=714109 RepID=A0A841FSQ6_9ACTN|nr:hypothetical protein [Phytomonospora endophytica]MBB6036347.1 hypothetical protein [Phytomonospora endophytica]GIG67254.1 hypothetical protein Pen01_35490 [Phytomonospora endophytica]